MKINEKNIAGYAVSQSPVDKDGWLLKRGEVNKNFQRRWFTLKGNLLFYFEKKTDKEPSGVIILEGCTIELAEHEEQYAFKIVFHGAGDRTYVLGADTQESMEAWMKALACASYDYMKLMVSELQRQLDEIIELEKAHAVSIFDDQVKKSDTTATKTAISGNFCPKPGQMPTAPPRRKAVHSKTDVRFGPGSNRMNPFNRCQSEEDFERSSHVTSHPNSAPGTPRFKRTNGSFKTYCDLPNRVSDSLQGRQAPNRMIKMFQDLHQRYGATIEKDITLWQQKIAEPQVGQLISFD